MIPFYSKRNQVYPSIKGGICTVEKHFRNLTDWERECEAYDTITGKLPIPAVIRCKSGLLATEYLPYPSFLSVLEEQERCGFSKEPWIALAGWLQDCYKKTGILPFDANLRNFLWDVRNNTVYGIDLESYAAISICDCGAALTALLLTYDPSDTPTKKAAAEAIASCLKIEQSAISDARDSLLARREKRISKKTSGIILAGGKSHRMGRNKSELMLLGKSLLQWQIEKMQAVGIEDIMISGEPNLRFPDLRIIQDEYPNRGPLAGMHACLKQAEKPQCLVLGVDAPLVPSNVLSRMINTHDSGATILRHPAGEEPLIGVYDSSVHYAISDLIRDSGAPVRALKDKIKWNCFDYLGPEEWLINCNSPEDYSAVCSLARALAEYGISL